MCVAKSEKDKQVAGGITIKDLSSPPRVGVPVVRPSHLVPRAAPSAEPSPTPEADATLALSRLGPRTLRSVLGAHTPLFKNFNIK